MRSALLRSLLAAVALVTVFGSASAVAEDAGGELELRPYVGQLRTLQVEIEGRPATMIFDTGAGMSSITPAFAAQVGCAPYGVATAFRMDGERVTFQRCPALSVRIGPLAMERELRVFDLAAVLPEGLPPVDGVIGLDLFEGRVVTMLPELAAIRIETRRSLARAVARRAPGRLRLAREAGGAGLTAFVPAASRLGDVWLLLDSANLAGVRLHPWAHAALSGETASAGVRLAVEGAPPRTIEPEVLDALIYDGALNADFLARHTITLDLSRGRIWWREPD
jgi:hypothetical protein